MYRRYTNGDNTIYRNESNKTVFILVCWTISAEQAKQADPIISNRYANIKIIIKLKFTQHNNAECMTPRCGKRSPGAVAASYCV